MEQINNIRKKEQKDLFEKQIDEIKSIFFGRDTSLLEYTHKGYAYSQVQTDELISKILYGYKTYCENNGAPISSNFIDFCTAFIQVSILICHIGCRKSDYIFESILKFSKVAYKHPHGGVSILDIIVGDTNTSADFDIFEHELNTLNTSYKKFLSLHDECYTNNFEYQIRDALDIFLEAECKDLFNNSTIFSRASQLLSMNIRRLHSLSGQNDIGVNN